MAKAPPADRSRSASDTAGTSKALRALPLLAANAIRASLREPAPSFSSRSHTRLKMASRRPGRIRGPGVTAAAFSHPAADSSLAIDLFRFMSAFPPFIRALAACMP